MRDMDYERNKKEALKKRYQNDPVFNRIVETLVMLIRDDKLCLYDLLLISDCVEIRMRELWRK